MERRPRLTSEQRSTAIGMLHGVAASTICPYRDLNKNWRVQDRCMTRIVVTSSRNRLMSVP